MTKFPREVTHMNFTNPRAEKSRSLRKNNQETQFRISYTATGQELIYGYVPVGNCTLVQLSKIGSIASFTVAPLNHLSQSN